jgi:hypothetical protein
LTLLLLGLTLYTDILLHYPHIQGLIA